MSAAEPVTVAVVNFEGERHLRETLPAVSTLEGPIAERLLVDSGSTDASLPLVRSAFPGFRVLELGSNLGPAAARNRALREAGTRLVLLLDNDVAPARDSLVRLLDAAEPGVAALAPRALLDADRGRIHYDGGGFHFAGLLAFRNFYRPLEEAGNGGRRDIDGAAALALLVDREAVLEIGGFEERYFILFEDQDLCFRLRATGRRILSVPDAIVFHRSGTAGFSLRPGARYAPRRVFLHSRNHWMFVLRNYRRRTLLAALPGLLLYEVAAFLLALRSGGFREYLRGKAALAREVEPALRARADLEGRRALPDRSLLKGRPLTVTPALLDGPCSRAAMRALEGALAAWWGIARRFAG